MLFIEQIVMRSTKYLTVLIYAIGLASVNFYINLIRLGDRLKNDLHEKSYDYIVVGSGSAGSIIALRLSEKDDTTVLVIEAGSYGGELLDVPMGGPGLQRTAADWQYKTVPQNSSCFGLDKNQSHWPLGKIIGGSMYLNNLVYARGHPNDYKNWFGDTFDYEEDILKYFKKSENQQGSYKNDYKYHSTSGPFIVEDIPFVSEFGEAVLEAAEELGFPIRDVNAEHNTGLMKTQVSVRSGHRYTTGHYLLEQNRSNVNFLTQATVREILFHSDFEARGVAVERFGETYEITAKKGVVLSAGTIGTAKILLQSGVGPKEHLRKVGIEPKIDLPVGRNLQDHVTTGVDLILLNKSIDMSIENAISPRSIYEYVFHGRGPLSSPGCEVIGLFDFDGDEVPDLQWMVVPLGISADGGIHFRKAMGISDESFKGYFSKLLFNTTVTILPILLHPKSVGYVELNSNDAADAPIINPNYLEDASDVEIILKGIDVIKEFLQTEALQKLGATVNTMIFPGCETHNFDTKEYWECYIRHLTLTCYHPVGTCKLGQADDESAVVERNFKVRNTNKLFVADASVMPSLPSGNTNAAVIMIAEKAAESIKNEEFLSKGFNKLSIPFLSV